MEVLSTQYKKLFPRRNARWRPSLGLFYCRTFAMGGDEVDVIGGLLHSPQIPTWLSVAPAQLAFKWRWGGLGLS